MIPPEPPLSTEDESLARHREALRERFPLPAPKPRKPRKTLAAGALLVLVAAGLAWFDPAYHSEQYSSAVGTRKVVDLADGSRLVLDSHSRVVVSWHLRSRRAQLVQGQVLFNINKTLVRPFQVDVGTARIQVLGTRFNVLRDDERVSVSLLRGSIDLQSGLDPDRHIQLSPGEQVQVVRGELQPVVKPDMAQVLAWRDRRLVFAHTPLSEVIAQVRRYRQAPIRMDDPSLADLSVSGVFDTDKVEDLLALLPHILPLRIARDTDDTLHITRKVAKK